VIAIFKPEVVKIHLDVDGMQSYSCGTVMPAIHVRSGQMCLQTVQHMDTGQM